MNVKSCRVEWRVEYLFERDYSIGRLVVIYKGVICCVLLVFFLMKYVLEYFNFVYVLNRVVVMFVIGFLEVVDVCVFNLMGFVELELICVWISRCVVLVWWWY